MMANDLYLELEYALRAISYDQDGSKKTFQQGALKANCALTLCDNWDILLEDATAMKEMKGWRSTFKALLDSEEQPNEDQLRSFLIVLQQTEKKLRA